MTAVNPWAIDGEGRVFYNGELVQILPVPISRGNSSFIPWQACEGCGRKVDVDEVGMCNYCGLPPQVVVR